jgi:hypothetical protein
VFLLRRSCTEQRLIVAASMLPETQRMPVAGTGLPQGRFFDQLSNQAVEIGETLTLAPYQVLWLDVTGAAE